VWCLSVFSGHASCNGFPLLEGPRPGHAWAMAQLPHRDCMRPGLVTYLLGCLGKIYFLDQSPLICTKPLHLFSPLWRDSFAHQSLIGSDPSLPMIGMCRVGCDFLILWLRCFLICRCLIFLLESRLEVGIQARLPQPKCARYGL
jgi:hypothetical protein